VNYRQISPELQAHLDAGATTLTVLIKVTPKNQNYAPFGICKLDRDLVYDDGLGEVNYAAMIGMVLSDMQSTSTMEVGNSEGRHLIPEAQFNIQVDEELIRAGVYDWADYVAYVVNYEDLSMGHWIPPAGFGQTGQLSVDDRGLSFRMELTDLSKILKQTIVEKDSITCRADYGSQPIGTGGGVKEQRFPCGATVTWSSTQTVTAASSEPTISFTASGLGQPDNTYVPGMLEWISGPNAGRSQGVSEQDEDGNISVYDATQFPVSVGHSFRIRHDCTKWVYGTHGCKENFGGGDEWKLHYRGEPFIPISDADAVNTPGATVGTGSA
jgi:uncharacterized phage protein (TIGR02218 family)